LKSKTPAVQHPRTFGSFSLGIGEMLFKGFYPMIYDQDIGDYFETYVEQDFRQLVN
jgi:hypothetical protein